MTGEIKAGSLIISEVVKLAATDPEARAAGHELGKAAHTVTKAINNALLPLAAVNFAISKFQVYFAERFPSELAAKTASIPDEDVIEPKASVAGPAIQGLAFSHEEPDLKEMYVSLLATAMDGRIAEKAHPAFVEIIRQIDAKEASLLRGALTVAMLPIVEIRLKADEPNAWTVLRTHVLRLGKVGTNEPVEMERLPAVVDNWIRLGLVSVSYDKHMMSPNIYDWVELRPEVIRVREQQGEDVKNVLIQKGVMLRTALGEQFGRSVGIIMTKDVSSSERSEAETSPAT